MYIYICISQPQRATGISVPPSTFYLTSVSPTSPGRPRVGSNSNVSQSLNPRIMLLRISPSPKALHLSEFSWGLSCNIVNESVDLTTLFYTNSLLIRSTAPQYDKRWTNLGPESSVNGMTSGPYAGSITASRFGGVARVVTTSGFHFPVIGRQCRRP